MHSVLGGCLLIIQKQMNIEFAGQQVTGCHMAQRVIHDQMVDLDHEEVWIIHLTGANTVISTEMISRGTLNQTSIDCRTVLRAALLQNAAAIIIAHNHPSGIPLPGRADIQFTGELKAACSLLDIRLLDNIIIAKDSFYSFAQEQTIKY